MIVNNIDTMMLLLNYVCNLRYLGVGSDEMIVCFNNITIKERTAKV